MTGSEIICIISTFCTKYHPISHFENYFSRTDFSAKIYLQLTFVLQVLSSVHCPGTESNNNLQLMSLVSHRKSYLVCVELTNFQLFMKPIPNFFQDTKLRQPTESRDNCLKINKYYIIFAISTIMHIPNSFSYEKQGTLSYWIELNVFKINGVQ